MATPFEPTVIRASSLSMYADCSRRSAARMFGREIKAAGFKLRELQRGIASAIGTAVHAAASTMLIEKAKSGGLPPADFATDCAIENLKEAIRAGVTYDREAPVANDAELQTARMARTYRSQVAPAIHPIIVEERLEAVVTDNIALSGQADVVAREPGRVRDLKTGKSRGNFKPQLGAYSLLARTKGIDVHEVGEDWIPRVGSKKPQPDAQMFTHDLGAVETAAINVLRHIEDDLRTFREGDVSRRILPGDPWAFLANPGSKLCGEKYCEAFGTDFCREHQEKEEE